MPAAVGVVKLPHAPIGCTAKMVAFFSFRTRVGYFV